MLLTEAGTHWADMIGTRRLASGSPTEVLSLEHAPPGQAQAARNLSHALLQTLCEGCADAKCCGEWLLRHFPPNDRTVLPLYSNHPADYVLASKRVDDCRGYLLRGTCVDQHSLSPWGGGCGADTDTCVNLACAHAHARARTHARTHARTTRARTHARTHARTRAPAHPPVRPPFRVFITPSSSGRESRATAQAQCTVRQLPRQPVCEPLSKGPA